MAEFRISSLRFTYVGAWAATTSYNKDDVVSYGGKLYTVETAHTSSDVYSDVASGNLSLTLDGKSFKGEYNDGDYYDVNDIVTVTDSKSVYICNTEHTGTDPIDLTKWDLLVQYESWNNEWQPDTDYTVGSIVKYGGSVYICNADHTSAPATYNIPIVSLNGNGGTATVTFVAPILTGVVTNPGETITISSVNPSSYNGTYTIVSVLNNSIEFLCTASENYVSGGTLSVSNNADWGGLEVDESNWDVYFEGVEYKGDYQGSFRYKVNDLVKNGASIYKCNTAHTSATIPTLDITKFDMYVEGEEYIDAWNSSTAYNPGDIVSYGGYSYVSIAFNNVSNTPEIPSLHWELFNRGYEFQNTWSNSTNYKVGSVVRRTGGLYVAIVDNSGTDPKGNSQTKIYNSTGSSGTTIVLNNTTGLYPGMIVAGLGFTTGPIVKTVVNGTTVILTDGPTGSLTNGQSIYFTGHNGEIWNIVSTSVNYVGFWSLGGAYLVDDIVVYGNKTYKCVRNTSGQNPEEDADNLYWVIYLAHNQKNVLRSQGDIRIIDADGITTRLAIANQNGYNLYSDGVSPTWKKTFVSPNLFYVSTDNGVDDSASYGTTWDRPFKTIAYAANYVKNGVLNQGTAQLLRNNKAFIREEIIQWMYYQMQTNNAPFSSGSVWDEDKSRRDLYLIIDSLIYDLSRGGNSQTVATTLSFFKLGSQTEWFNAATEAASDYIVASLTYLNNTLLPSVLNGTPVLVSYQSLRGISSPYAQSFGASTPQGVTDALSLLDLLVTSLTNQNNSNLPVPNQGVAATIYVKTGTYKESNLPMVVPANCCIQGDELRGVTVEPSKVVNTIVTRSYSLDNTLEAYSTADMYINCPVVFVTSNAFGATGVAIQRFESTAIEVGTTYYIKEIVSDTKFKISSSPNGTTVAMAGEVGTMLIYGGEALGDMFRMRNGSGLRNMTLAGLLGTLGPINQYLTQRPTGGAFVCLDPGTGPSDSEAWIIRRSPYIQNVTTFGIGCIGMKIDGTLHNGGNKSIVCNDYTQILSDGIGIWCTGAGSLCEAVSVFSYYGYAGYFSEDGGRIRATNGNSSYGQLGVVAEGYDITETPISGNVFNRQYETQANIGFVDDTNSGILNYTFSNAGENHFTPTTNLLTYSNDFTGASWTNDGNVTLTRGSSSPDNLTNAWLFTALTSTSNNAFLTQGITITPSNGFTLVNQPYTLSLYLKEGTVAYTDIHAVFSGNTTKSSGIRFNWSTKAVSTVDAAGDGGMTPTSYGVETLSNSWYRVWFVVYDNTALNSTLTFKIYPRGKDGGAGYVFVYGPQIENGSTLGTYLDNKATTRFSAYANFVVVGNGSNAQTVANEIRSQAVFETRITDPNDGYGVGGQNYLTSSNAAQTGTDFSLTLANADTNLSTNYVGMALYLISGAGVGQYGQISSYNSTSKVATIAKSSFESVQITASSASTNRFDVSALADFNSLYVNQPVQFLPFYYNTTASATSQDYVAVTASTGGQTNTFTVASTARLSVGMPITFTGTVFGGVINNYTYYISDIVDGTTIRIATRLFGTTLFLNTATGSMTLNYGSNSNYITVASTSGMTPNLPIQFSGNTMGSILASNIYYINDVLDGTTLKISSSLVTTSVTATTVTTNIITGSTTGLVANNPIVFAGTSFGNITAGTKYYISDIVSSTQFKISTSLIYTTCSQTTTSLNRFTVASTTGMLVGSPVTFYGNVFGGVVAEQTYWILTIPTSNTITVTATRGSSTPVTLNTVSGFMFVRTAPASVNLSTASGTLTGTSTSVVKTLTPETGSMTVVYQTSLFGGITQGTTYYVLSKITGGTNQITLTATDGGSTPVTLTTATGSMSLLAAGWDNVIPGKANAALLDTSSYYFIEPRLSYSAPPFTQVSVTLPSQTTAYTSVGYGDGYWLALGTNTTTLARSVNGTTWTTATLPASTTWSGLGYGNKYWVALRTASNLSHFSNDNGVTWKQATMPSSANWTHIAFGNNIFVAIDNTNSSAKVAYSTNYGSTWSSATLSLTPASGWKSIAYGGGVFVAVPGGSTNTVSYSTDYGATWATATLPITTTWESVAYGNGRFVAVSSTSNKPAYSFNGVTWYSGNYSIASNRIAYGQGVFVAIANGSTTGYTSEDGLMWKTRSITSSTYTGMAFGYDSSNVGKWVTVAGQTTGSVVQAGATARVRGVVTTGQLESTLMLEPGSNYTSAPTLTIFDPNATISAVPQIRRGSGSLANPTFINRGTEYATNTTYLNVLGRGFADQYQTDLYINVNNLTLLPRSGDNLSITGDNTVYKVTSAEILNGSTAPSITARLGISPAMSFYSSPAHGTSLIIRQKYSQVRLTNHDWLNIGFGDQVDSNYPGTPPFAILSPQDQTIENNFGRVFYTSTDQDGNFKVGSLFGVEQATGIVTISASQFGLSGLSALSLGGISVGNISVVIRQFSVDPTFVANSDNILPTQKAVKSYIASRLSQGGANTFTGNLVAGVVSIGGANIITSTLAPGVTGSTIQIPVKMRFGAAGVDGNMMAQAFFSSTWNKSRRVF